MKIKYENKKVEKLVKISHIENVIDWFLETFNDATIEEIKEIFVSDNRNEVKYFFYDDNNDVIFETYNKKSDLN